VAPPILSGPAGVSYEEYNNLDEAISVVPAGNMPVSAGAAGRYWADGLRIIDSQVLARYDHQFFGDFAAITTHSHGVGRITYCGTVPNRILGADLFGWIVPTPLAARYVLRPQNVTVSSGVNQDSGDRIIFIHNWRSTRAEVQLLVELTDTLTSERISPGIMRLDPWGCRVLLAPKDT
jgi:beta-galactosidase